VRRRGFSGPKQARSPPSCRGGREQGLNSDPNGDRFG
jgi:hypothetical protein